MSYYKYIIQFTRKTIIHVQIYVANEINATIKTYYSISR